MPLAVRASALAVSLNRRAQGRIPFRASREGGLCEKACNSRPEARWFYMITAVIQDPPYPQVADW